jgi:hypothetical protein
LVRSTSDELPANLKARAAEIVRDLREAASDQRLQQSKEELETVVGSLEQELRVVSADAEAAGERITKIEAQTRVLAEAVIAITDTAIAVAPAIQAVKDEM